MFGWAVRIMPTLFLCGLAIAAERPSVWLDVPFVRQEKNGCGAAGIAMIMQYWQRQQPGEGRIATAEEIQRALYCRRARGIYASDLEWYLQQHGFRTFVLRGEWADLQAHLEKGRPLIVALNSGHGDLHYVVVTGLDSGQEIVVKHDPAVRKLLKQHRTDFEREWKAAGTWTLLALPAHDGESSTH
jgi:ABC-type bacteriocin/lantibiotic exporter with double-glycine peptidase domain